MLHTLPHIEQKINNPTTQKMEKIQDFKKHTFFPQRIGTSPSSIIPSNNKKKGRKLEDKIPANEEPEEKDSDEVGVKAQ